MRQPIATLKGHRAKVGSVAFARDGQTLATASSDHTVKLWDLPPRPELPTFTAMRLRPAWLFRPTARRWRSDWGSRHRRQATIKARSACGIFATLSRLRSSRVIPTWYTRLLTRPTARGWPAAAATSRSFCGTCGNPNNTNSSLATPTKSTPWHSRRMAVSWPAAAATGRSFLERGEGSRGRGAFETRWVGDVGSVLSTGEQLPGHGQHRPSGPHLGFE